MSIKNDRAGQKNFGELQEALEPNVPSEGVFNRPDFAKTVTSLIGNNVKVKTKNGATYEGVFTALTSDFDVVVDGLSEEIGLDDELYNRVCNGSIFFKPEDIVSISCVNVNYKEALDISHQSNFSENLTANDNVWDESCQNSEAYNGWNELLKAPNGNFGNSEYSDGLGSFSSIYAHSDFEKVVDGSADFKGKPQNSPGGSMSEFPREPVEKTSNLNPNAKPFTPSDYQIPLAAVVLPTYVVSGNTSSKSDPYPQMSGGGSQYLQYPYDYDDKLYSSYDSLPISAHDYQQYYPHLQYIQYFRRFY